MFMVQRGSQGAVTLRAFGLRVVVVMATLCLVACGDSSPSPSAAVSTEIPDSDADSEGASYLEAFRLLRQATFGADAASLARVQELGVSAWLDEQIQMSSAYDSAEDEHLSHLQMLELMATSVEPGLDWYRSTDAAESYFYGDVSGFTDIFQNSVWFANALDGPDQLRQRVAYALSQIMVVSAFEFPLERRAEALAHYYDILAKHAFGNFRELLGDIARSPAMGVYLSHQGNRKGNPARNTLPDENFARELMQLFTIGLYELNLDGSSKSDAQGQLIPSYGQGDIEELSRVMTGWDLQHNDRYGAASQSQGSFVHFMEYTNDEHDFGAKQVLGTEIPAGLSVEDDLDAALDILFYHDNTAPFIAKQLIQRLVTSNPSPLYIGRVAQAFVDNGQGQRGDMAAVVRAVLLDIEARNPLAAETDRFGKASEPLLAYTALLRAFDVQPIDGWSLSVDDASAAQSVAGLYYFRVERELGQAALRSPSVFNFYSPDFIPQDDFYNEKSLALPEMQLRTPQNIAGFQKLLLLHERLLERNDLERRYGAVDAFVAQKGNWNNSAAIALVDYTFLLQAFERALEGDQNGDFQSISAIDTNDDGMTPREVAISRLIDLLELTLRGEAIMDADTRLQTIDYFRGNSYFNQKNASTVELAHRIVAGMVQFMALSHIYLAQQ